MTKEELVAALRKVAFNSAPVLVDSVISAMGGGPKEKALITTLAPISVALYNLAADIVESGHDPVAVITRITDVRPWLDATELSWNDRIARKPVP